MNRMSDLRFGEFRIDRSRRQLCCGEEPIPLPAKAFDLLVYMAANPGRLLPKGELLSAVWPDSFVEESNLTQNVFILRRVLKAGAEGAILTVPGRGYQFTTEVAEVPPRRGASTPYCCFRSFDSLPNCCAVDERISQGWTGGFGS